MASSSIRINGSPTPVENIVIGATVNLTNFDDTGATTWAWVMVSKPNGSTATIAAPSAAATSFVADKEGSYLIRLTVNGTLISTAVARIVATHTGYKLLARDEIEEGDASGVEGWARPQRDSSLLLDKRLGLTNRRTVKYTGANTTGPKLLKVTSAATLANSDVVPGAELATGNGYGALLLFDKSIALNTNDVVSVVESGFTDLFANPDSLVAEDRVYTSSTPGALTKTQAGSAVVVGYCAVVSGGNVRLWFAPGAASLTGTGVAGGVAFWSSTAALTSDSANLFWDDSLNRLGIGLNGPTAPLDVQVTGAGSGIRVNAQATGWPVVTFAIDGTLKALWGVARAGGDVVNDSNAGDFGFRSNAQQILFSVNNGTSSAGKFLTNGDFAVDTNTLYVDATNNRVGVGTISPEESLDVASGGMAARGDIIGTTGTGLFSSYQVSVNTGHIHSATWGTTLRELALHGLDLSFRTGTTTSTEKARLKANGDFLIDTNTFYVDATNNRIGTGTITPKESIDVNVGGIAIRGGINGAAGEEGVYLAYLANEAYLHSVLWGTTFRNFRYNALDHIFLTGTTSTTEKWRIVHSTGGTFSSSVVSGSDAIKILDGSRINLSTGDASAYLHRTAANTIGTPGTLVPVTAVRLGSGGNYGWSSAADGSAAADTTLTRSAVGVKSNFGFESNSGAFTGFSAGTTSGSNAFKSVDGARWNLSTADSSAYLHRVAADTIAAASAFQAGSFQGPGGASGFMTVSGGLQMSTNKAIYFNGATQTKYVFWDGTFINMVGTPRLHSDVADGASAVGSVVDTINTLANASAKLLSIRNNTVEKAFFYYDGSMAIPTTTAKVFCDNLETYNSERMTILGFPTNGATAVGTRIGAGSALVHATSKVLQIVNNGVDEKAYFDKDGYLYTGAVFGIDTNALLDLGTGVANTSRLRYGTATVAVAAAGITNTVPAGASTVAGGVWTASTGTGGAGSGGTPGGAGGAASITTGAGGAGTGSAAGGAGGNITFTGGNGGADGGGGGAVGGAISMDTGASSGSATLATINIGTANAGVITVGRAGQKTAIGGTPALTDFLDDSANTGSRTVNKASGINAFAATTSNLTITNDRVTATSGVFVVIQTNDATAVLKNVPVTSGSFDVNLTANTTGVTKFYWYVLNN